MRLGLVRGVSGRHPDSLSGTHGREVQIPPPGRGRSNAEGVLGAKMEMGAFSMGFSFLLPLGLRSTVVVGRESSGYSGIAER